MKDVKKYELLTFDVDKCYGSANNTIWMKEGMNLCYITANVTDVIRPLRLVVQGLDLIAYKDDLRKYGHHEHNMHCIDAWLPANDIEETPYAMWLGSKIIFDLPYKFMSRFPPMGFVRKMTLTEDKFTMELVIRERSKFDILYHMDTPSYAWYDSMDEDVTAIFTGTGRVLSMIQDFLYMDNKYLDNHWEDLSNAPEIHIMRTDRNGRRYYYKGGKKIYA